jgi:hypothetical protein
MKYELMLRWIPDAKESIQERHATVMRVLDPIPQPWGFGSKGGPSAPDAGRELLAGVRLDSFLGRGVRGSVVYRYRGGLEDAGMYDDYLRLEFNPARVDYVTLLGSALSQYIQGLQPYRAHCGPEELTVVDFDALRRTDYRRGIHRFYPVMYVGRHLCSKALNFFPEDLVRRVAKECERAELLNNGAFLVMTSEVVDVSGAEAINQRIWASVRQVSAPSIH